MKSSFRNALLFCVFLLLFFLTVPYVSALETIQVNPPVLSLKKGETKKLSLAGKNLNNAKSALVFQRNSPKREFTTKLTCQGATSCLVSLTLKAQVAPGSYSVKLLDARKKPITEGSFKLSPPSGKATPKSSRSLRPKAGKSLPASKILPKSNRDLRPKPKALPSSKILPKTSRDLRPKPKTLPSSKILPKTSRDLRPKPKTLPSSKILPKSSQDLRPKPKTLPSSKILPKSKRDLRPKAGKSLPSSKILPKTSRDLRPKAGKSLPASKILPKSSRELKSKQKLDLSKSDRSRIPGRTRKKPFGKAELASIKLAKQKVGSGETVLGTITLKKKAPAPNGVKVALFSGDAKLAKVEPMLIPAGQIKANFTIKTGVGPGAVKITAKLGKITLITSLLVKAPSVDSAPENSPEDSESDTQPEDSTPETSGEDSSDTQPEDSTSETESGGATSGTSPAESNLPFQPVVINTPALTSIGDGEGRADTAPAFQPVTIDTAVLTSVGDGEGRADTAPAFQPVTINTSALTSIGNGEGRQTNPPSDTGPSGVAFTPLTATGGALSMTGDRQESVSFTPLTATGGALSMTGDRQESVAFEPLTVTGGALSMTGDR
jgi:hypothetical protein